MPVPGQPRNPLGQTPTRFELETPRFVGYSGPSIDGANVALAFVQVSKRGLVLAFGQLRHVWKQRVGYIPAADDFSWTMNGPPTNLTGMSAARGFQVTRALRYWTRSLYFGAGSDNTRLSELHSVVVPRVRHKPITVGAGQMRGRPVTRNRLTSFGSRVPPLQQRPNNGTKP